MTLTLQSVSNIQLKPRKAEVAIIDKNEGILENPQQSCSLSCETQSIPEGDNDNCLNFTSKTLLVHGSKQEIGMMPYLHSHSSSIPSFNSGLSSISYLHQYRILNPQFIKSSKENYICPIFDEKFQQVILQVECGRNQAFMYLNRLCQGSKGPCILFKNCYWLTPNEFQFISGRETAKDWKRSIRHNGKSIKLLINKGILFVHSPLCECGSATPSSIKMNKFPFDKKEEGSEYHLSPSFPQGSGSNGGNKHETWTNSLLASNRESGPEDVDSVGSGSGSSSRSLAWTYSEARHTLPPGLGEGVMDPMNQKGDDLILNVNVSSERCSPLSRSSSGSSSLSITAAESQSEEASITGSAAMNNNNESPTPPKSKRKSKAVAVKSERHSPQLSSSTTSPPMTPPPPNSSGPNNTGSSSPPPQPPIKQMEQMMGTCRNYSDFMRSLAAKYNNQNSNITSDYYSRTANFGFDTRFLKPAAAAAILNMSQIPTFDMSSTQALLSMVRSASAAAANSLENLKAGSGQNHKRPNSPLDLSSRDMPGTPPPIKKPKIRNPLLETLNLKRPGTPPSIPCLSSCSTGCTEEAQTMINWSVEEVCRFVAGIDLCKEYVEVFREHAIDGSSLALLTEEHLMNAMNMKLGPALKFRSTVAKKLGTCAVCSHCQHCHNNSNSPPTSSP